MSLSLGLTLVLLLAACTSDGGDQGRSTPQETTPSPPPQPTSVELPDDSPGLSNVIPAPETVEPAENDNFALDSDTEIRVPAGDADAHRAGEYLAEQLRPATGFALPVRDSAAGNGHAPNISLQPGGDELPAGGYELDIAAGTVQLRAGSADGLFSGVQTIRQLLPSDIERDEVVDRRWAIAGGTVEDRPRFAYRGAMLDVARHFFDVDVVKRHIDRIAQYKINYLHLHLSDDQGWRIEIESWPELTEVGGATQVGGGAGGYYTQEEYREIVEYADARGVTIVPELDMPGHTNAALVSYPELNCDGNAPEPYTGTRVGFSSLCIDSEITYEFVRDVVTEVAELTTGDFLHVGGDEAEETTDAAYATFFSRVLPMITGAGKRPVGWHEYAGADLPESAVVQYWRIETEHAQTRGAAADGHDIVMSPADKSYLDMKYHDGDPWGNDWAGAVNVHTAYQWDPAQVLSGVTDEAVLGVETPLWTELVETESEIERMAFPRIQAIAEVGWSAQSSRDWQDFRQRLAADGKRMSAQGINYHPSPEIPW